MGAPPVLLFDAGFYGTLAAVRSLGRAGVPVVVADPDWLAPASWSRHASRRLRAPGPCHPAFFEWLLALGEREPGHVLLPTSDDGAFQYAANRDRLSRHFRLAVTTVGAVLGLLDKWRLGAAAAAVGLEVPETHAPADAEELDRLAERVRYPVLVKPRTQVLFEQHAKGVRAGDPTSLRRIWRQARAGWTFGAALRAVDPGVAAPLVQAYLPEAAEGIVSLSGWISAGDGPDVFRAARKLLQKPRRLGVGICFEHLDVDAELAARVGALCRRVGHTGLVEAEFIRCGGRSLLIDVNPRFYGQIGFDVARGLPLPLLSYLDALGETTRVSTVLARAAAWRPTGRPAFAHGFVMRVMLAAQRLSGSLPAEEFGGWRRFLAERRSHLGDFTWDTADRWPGFADAAKLVGTWLRHPRAFLRQVMLDR